MAKRRSKNRTHVVQTETTLKGIPKSMVIRVGQTSFANHSLNQLVKDFRQIMQPHTAIKLKERKTNKLKDFVVMCGPLGVSHLFMFTQSEKTGNVSLKVARTPQGPTITFQVVDYSLDKDIKRFLKRPKSLKSDDVLDPPLLVLNGFTTLKKNAPNEVNEEDKEKENVEKVIVSMFQNVFPPLNPSSTRLNSIKRVFLINKDKETDEISMRHYYLDVREVEISKNLKRLYKSKHNLSKSVPNLNRKEDISSLILDHDIGAYTSESEIEDEQIVKVIDTKDIRARKSLINKNKIATEKDEENAKEAEEDEDTVKQEETREELDDDEPSMAPRKKAIKLTELGPRLTLKLVKIEEGICSGKVLHHEFVQKTSAEIKALEKKHAEKMKLKEARKKEQEENIAKKKAVKDAKKARKDERRKIRKMQEENNGKNGGETIESNEDENSSSDSDSDDEAHYGDVPEDIDSDLYSDVDVE
ncbi:hypothetical protein TBLA_0A03040 [Henningerozyma blattae CBS 6284]|uniref:Brix domain-containing protein n=1 Tax=Henningerozyma blattae (strain ATCC 34711 / CBS 6284 / DSM 70876 / NBRC 10599 / NRRL Y-10934 / UCD 77-7) TaxID=1071380 RepID=I2GVF2_HENB6|nr:hypothetical protein TBLA_0A03040 [Tetrapisispora blattae CBS 6284]CCH58104.1 hypothetical protein TBLA_0A03040 [Tetrapisispora blattae CBS 6284]